MSNTTKFGNVPDLYTNDRANRYFDGKNWICTVTGEIVGPPSGVLGVTDPGNYGYQVQLGNASDQTVDMNNKVEDELEKVKKRV